MHENDVAAWLAIRLLRLDQNLHARLGRVELRFDRIAFGIKPPWPKVPGDGQDMVIGYNGTERPQAYILARRAIRSSEKGASVVCRSRGKKT